MHHVVLDRWSRGGSALHRRDARAKTIAVLVFLIALGTAQRAFLPLSLFYLGILAAAILAAGLPIVAALKRAAVVLPFTAVFAAISLAAGEPMRAAALVGKSYLSALAVLVLVSTTPLPELLGGLERMGVPRYLLMVAQFLYRYLFVISEEAQHMRAALQAKSGTLKRTLWDRAKFGAAGRALGVLFARSYAHAEGIHQAMLARGFQGHFLTLSGRAFGRADAFFVAAALVIVVGARAAVEAWI
ncbi:MAG: energy-coupling factor transporter transmembrane protein EcfT [Acidobacteriia bacterium]|nr:energy-coupling factor transporter transmembrane protein EcfT [Terriglobia bacterium]